MMRFALILPLALAGCVASPSTNGDAMSSVQAGTPFQIGGATVLAEQKRDWPLMIPSVDAAGNTQEVQSGTAPTVIVSGAPDFDTAVAALGQFCGRTINPMGFDTQYVFKDRKTGNYWFDGFCG